MVEAFYITSTKPELNKQVKSYELKLFPTPARQSHFSEINAKLAEKNEFTAHFVQKCFETRENFMSKCGLNESSKALGNRSEIVTDFGSTCHGNS